MAVTVAIINWNSGPLLCGCIESVLETAPRSEIVVVDNGSEDESLESASRYRAQAHFVRNSVNRGFAGAVNQAFEATSTAYVLILNPDVQATPGAIDYLEQLMDSRREAGAAGGRLDEGYPPRRLPTTATLVRQNLGLGVGRMPGSGVEPREVEQPAGAALMIRRDAYDNVGCFDEQFYPAWYEDVDFCRRLRTAGWKVLFAPRAWFRHQGGYSAQVMGPSAFLSAYYRNQFRYVRKHLGPAADIAVRSSVAAGMIGRMAARPAEARAYWNVLRGALLEW